MQALKSLFSRAQSQVAAASAKQPLELSPESLKLVGGGLPRVSDPAGCVVDTTSDAIIGGDEDATQLPRVS